MDAHEYIKRIQQICKDFEDNGECNSCPLSNLLCGIPRGEDKITTVIDLVENYIKAEEAKCPTCGKKLSE